MGCRFEPYLWSHLSFPGFHRPSVLGLPFGLFPQFPVVPVLSDEQRHLGLCVRWN